MRVAFFFVFMQLDELDLLIPASESVREPLAYYDNNFVGTLNLLKARPATAPRPPAPSAGPAQSSCCSHFRNILSSRAADMPSKIGRTHGLVVEPRPRAHRKAKAKMSASTKQNSDKHISGAKATGVHQAFTNGYQGGPSSIL